MKLAFCLYKYFPWGGLQRDFLRIAKECVRRGHSVDVFTMQWEGPKDHELQVSIIPKKGIQNHTRARHFYAAVRRKLPHYDRVIGFNKMPGLDIYYAADTCFQAKARAQHGDWYRLTPRYRHAVAYEKTVFAPESHTQILLLSSAEEVQFRRFYQTPQERFHLLPPGITKDRIAPVNAAQIRQHMRLKLSVHPDEFLLLMVGSGFKTKGLDRALRGLASLSESLQKKTSLYILGKDNPTRFQRLAKKLKISDRVHFLGGRDDVAQFMLAADLLLHPAYHEMAGMVLLEGLAAGLPVLTTEVCGYAHYVKEAEAGVVFKTPFSQMEFNTTLENMLTTQLRLEMQKKALAFTKTADIYHMPIHAVDLIEKI